MARALFFLDSIGAFWLGCASFILLEASSCWSSLGFDSIEEVLLAPLGFSGAGSVLLFMFS